MTSSPPAKSPRPVLGTVFAFPPNRDTLGGTAYLIVNNDSPGTMGSILVDAPPWDDVTQDFIATQGGVRWLVITHRNALGQTAAIQKCLGCEVVIQEQEAYLLPGTPKTTFHHHFRFGPDTEAFWTPGYSPGSACVYHNAYGGILFTGRHLLPNRQGQPTPLRFAKTFHWQRQIHQVEALTSRFSPATLAHICPGANTGFLRGQRTIDQAYTRLQQLDFTALHQATAVL
ncbi:MAG TPA: MBL fold metallo-hydrolase [Leptolyngbyaceae cyanobacterium M65_K2018_010]|nr:MBL fold metallo-hydrolase [Leptolyngbyaceae cyanobacterium M65_K2018_010]